MVYHIGLKKQGRPKPHDLPRMSTLGLKHKTAFSSNQEREMKDYIKQAAEIAMGMTGDEVRSFAKCGIYFNVEMPVSWDEDMKAGKKWLKLYLKRNDLTYRKAELTSYNRLLGWNQEATNAFMANLGELYERYKFKPTRIFAGVESGVTTVADSPKIVTPCGAKHVISPAAVGRGQLVTVMAAASATGLAIPPMFIFPRKTYKDMWVQAGPPGCIGHSSASGWHDADGFLKFLQHVQSVTNAIAIHLYAHHDYIPCVFKSGFHWWNREFAFLCRDMYVFLKLCSVFSSYFDDKSVFVLFFFMDIWLKLFMPVGPTYKLIAHKSLLYRDRKYRKINQNVIWQDHHTLIWVISSSVKVTRTQRGHNEIMTQW